MDREDAIGYSEFLPCTNQKKETTVPTTPTTTPKAPRARKPRPTQAVKDPVQAAKATAKATPAKADTKIKLPEDKNEQSTPTPKRTAKQDLARTVVEAVAGVFSDSIVLDRLASAGMTKADAEKIVSQWLHHLPTGSDGEGRYWPASLPRPDRSDWK